MGTQARSIVDADIEEIVDALNCALTAEYQAWFQYLISAALVRGKGGRNVAEEFESHAEEELGHAEKDLERIIQLGGKPVTIPSQWAKLHPEQTFSTSTDVKAMLNMNITGERDAIKIYNDLFVMTDGAKDPVTNMMVQEILSDECGHEQDLTVLLEDL